uniref:Ubiquitin-like domain-containing protein n=1 Tax=Panagrolaimus superbus TaxID=310955 RepID=A0A914Y5A3_9BILA
MSDLHSTAAFYTHIEWTFMNENGDIDKVDINKNRTIKYIRSKIENVCKIPMNGQCFTCFDDGRTFGKTFVENDGENICGESKVRNENVEESLYFTVKNKTGKTFMIKVNENDSLKNLMSAIQETCGIPWNQQCFTCFDGRTFSDEFWKNVYLNLFNDIKECSKGTADMIVAFESADLKTDDNAHAEFDRITENKQNDNASQAELLTEIYEHKFYDSVQVLKAVNNLICITEPFGLFKYRPSIVLQNDITKKDVDFTIFNENGDILKKNINIKNLIKNIRSKIQKEFDIPFNRQCFTCSDDEKNLKNDDENAYSNPTISIENVEESLYFTVVNNAKKTFLIKVIGNESIETLMLRIQEICGIPLNQQCFTCFDSRTLSDEFWETKYESILNHFKDSHNATTFVASALENIDDFDFDSNGIPDDFDTVEDDTVDDIEIINEVNYDQCLHVEVFHAINDMECFADGIRTNLNQADLQFVLNDEFYAKKLFVLSVHPVPNFCKTTSNAISSLIPKIVKCDLRLLDIYGQILSWKEYHFLVSSGSLQLLYIRFCTIKNDDDSTLTVDKLFGNLKLLKQCHLKFSDMSSMFEPDTVEKIVGILLRLKNLHSFYLHGLGETFDISAFAKFATVCFK